MECQSEDEEYVAVTEVEEQLNAVATTGNQSAVFSILLVNGKQKQFQLDSGSTVNIMADRTVAKLCRENSLDDLGSISKFRKVKFPIVRKSYRKLKCNYSDEVGRLTLIIGMSGIGLPIDQSIGLPTELDHHPMHD